MPVAGKLAKWDREKRNGKEAAWTALCQVCYVEPAVSLHESSLLRCCVAFASPGCRKGRTKGPSGGNQLTPDPWDEDVKLGHLFEKGQGGMWADPDPASFADIPGIQALCGILKAPDGPLRGDMTDAGGVADTRAYASLVCKACPDPARLFHPGGIGITSHTLCQLTFRR